MICSANWSLEPKVDIVKGWREIVVLMPECCNLQKCVHQWLQAQCFQLFCRRLKAMLPCGILGPDISELKVAARLHLSDTPDDFSTSQCCQAQMMQWDAEKKITLTLGDSNCPRKVPVLVSCTYTSLSDDPTHTMLPSDVQLIWQRSSLLVAAVMSGTWTVHTIRLASL